MLSDEFAAGLFEGDGDVDGDGLTLELGVGVGDSLAVPLFVEFATGLSLELGGRVGDSLAVPLFPGSESSSRALHALGKDEGAGLAGKGSGLSSARPVGPGRVEFLIMHKAAREEGVSGG